MASLLPASSWLLLLNTFTIIPADGRETGSAIQHVAEMFHRSSKCCPSWCIGSFRGPFPWTTTSPMVIGWFNSGKGTCADRIYWRILQKSFITQRKLSSFHYSAYLTNRHPLAGLCPWMQLWKSQKRVKGVFDYDYQARSPDKRGLRPMERSDYEPCHVLFQLPARSYQGGRI